MLLEEFIKFANEVRSKIYFDYDLKKSNWFNIGGKTKVYFKPDNLSDLILFLKRFGNKEKIHILGAGSNTLISDKTFDGVIIKLGKNFSNISILPNDVIVAGSACLDKKLSDFALENGVGNFEFLACIPGTIGGGLKMNAGCYGSDMSNILHEVKIIDRIKGMYSLSNKDLNMSYRKTILSNEAIIVSAVLKYNQEDKNEINKDYEYVEEDFPPLM